MKTTPIRDPSTRVRGRLRMVVAENFNRSEYTMYNRLPKKVRDSMRDSMQGNEVVCFVAGMGNQLVFVWRPLEVGVIKGKDGKTRPREIYASARLRLTGRGWNPLMLANYAKRVGIELEGLPLFEEHYPELAAAAA